jgi:hypothetical protein
VRDMLLGHADFSDEQFFDILKVVHEEVIRPFARATIDEILTRFPYSNILGATKILNVKTYETIEENKLEEFGDNEMLELVGFYGRMRSNRKGERFCQWTRSADTISEYKDFKYYVSNNFTGLAQESFVKLLMRDFSRIFPNLINLMYILLTIPVSTVDCERGFSRMNLIKTKLRNRLRADHLDQLMRISIEGLTFVEREIFIILLVGRDLGSEDIKSAMKVFYMKRRKI